jgi:hypothetical protein
MEARPQAMEWEPTHATDLSVKKIITKKCSKPNKVYKVSTERKTKLKYIMKGSCKWYLAEHPGGYRFLDQECSAIYLIGGNW